MSSTDPANDAAPRHFIERIIDDDQQSGKHGNRVVTRFPPEPNGYLHIGHAKSICLNFGMAEEYDGRCNLRFDDTNPIREDPEYVRAIQEDVDWLGFRWSELRHASDYFEQLYDYAVELIRRRAAYVDSSSPEEMRRMRGTLTEPGEDSPYRDRSVDENLDLFRRMRDGEFEDGAHVLRARIDMSAGNINMRDPTLYRIRNTPHQRTGDRWSIYPMYDYTHCLSDAMEDVTHSLCTLEFEDHRPLYEWVLEQLIPPVHPQQIEFARLSLEYTVLSKRRLLQLVEEGHVDGWDDPRMPTLRGLRRRGFTPNAIRDFCQRIGITKNDAWIEMGVLETAIRDDLNREADRRMAVLEPLKIVISTLPEGHEETLAFANHPQREERGQRQLAFTRELYVERGDFSDDPPTGWQRLVPGGEVRLRGAYVIRCDEVIRNEADEVTELRCSHDPDTLGRKPVGRKVKGVIHWVSAPHARTAEVRLFDRLFSVADPGGVGTLGEALNPDSVQVLTGCLVDPSLAEAPPESHWQFERVGYFVADREDHRADRPVFNRTITLRDTWSS